MKVISSIPEMRSWSKAAKRSGQSIALVPTMGFLHEGHLSLVRKGRERGDRLVVSIFANPLQFGPGEDFETYPQDFQGDCEALKRERVDIVFHPETSDIYPDGYQTYVDVEAISAPLCGGHRPGHFRGVATVVLKLFHIVAPDVAVFGLKDYQQVQVIRRMVEDLNLDVEIVACPTVREPDGLAMSSRNRYLNDEERSAALGLKNALDRAEKLVKQGQTNVRKIREEVVGVIAREPLAKLEYAEFCNPDDLRPVDEVRGPVLLALCVWVGKARLIDNTILAVGGPRSPVSGQVAFH
jgi:pantoate--beta-alanine ligase